jgi:hypothetical protein
MDRQGRAQAADPAAGPAAGVRFLRHLAVVLLVVAAVVLLALAWNHVEGGTGATGPHGPGARVPVVALRGGRVVARPGTRPGRVNGPVIIDLRMDLGLTSMFDPVNLPSLRHTLVIEAGAAAAVVIIDVIRRRWRRARHTRS